jgi:SpoVK/Ycf46/Vps4 family AAA+-type ATPase
MLITLGGHRSFLQRHGFQNDNLAEQLTVAYLEHEPSFDQAKALFVLRHRLQETEAIHQQTPLGYPEVFKKNLLRLQEELSLNDHEIKILGFTIFLHADSLLDDTADYLEHLTAIKLYRALSVILEIEEKDIKDALANRSMLSRSGLVKVDRDSAQRMRSKLELVSQSAYDLMMDEQFEPMDLLKSMVVESEPAKLTMNDYPYFEKQGKVLQAYLGHSLATHKKGVNVLIYGEPGTGKTEFIRTLAQSLSVSCYEVSNVDNDGDAIKGHQRLGACAAAQNLLKELNCVLMFDEVEDVFARDDYHNRSPAQARKAWFNQLLEENAIPTLWVSNQTDGIDPAFIRRFDLIFEMPIPSAKQRENLLVRYADGLLSAEATHRFSQHEHLSPAIIERANRVLKPLQETLLLAEQARDETFEMIVNQTLQLQEHRPLLKENEVALPSYYNPNYLNTTENMAELAESLKSCSTARLCLYGPPGTGKTAFGHYLAQTLGKRLIIKRASDLLNMYVGGTEANIAKAFAQAHEEEAILMIDEVDSFISNRDNAVRSWEVTAINEMLTQMERFSGIFIASTNRMDGLDPAAMRRFDLKIKADYLNETQRQGLFADTCQQFNLATDSVSLKDLTHLTAGDFAVLMRQHQFQCTSCLFCLSARNGL